MTLRFSALWPDRHMLWRWHFFAGLLCLPFVAFLALTGSIYLFKPQVDDWIDWQYDHLPPAIAPSPEQDVKTALSAIAGSSFLAYELPRSSHSAARVLVIRPDGEAVRVYINRNTQAVLKTCLEEHRFERLVFRLHGQLMLGNIGSVIMEMVASWTIVLIVTGVLLWWPHGRQSLAGIVYPRLRTKGRTLWRDLHAVTGVWTSLFLILFLVSGLPWSFVWGHALQSVENTTGRLTSVRDWEIGNTSVVTTITGHPMPLPVNTQPKKPMNMPGMDMPDVSPSYTPQPNLTGLNTVVQTAFTLSLPNPVLITPSDSVWTVRSDTQNRPLRESATIGNQGNVISREHFAQKGVIDRVIAYGVAAHEGQLFGWLNQIINLLVAIGLLLMSITAIRLWIQRKPAGSLGIPPLSHSQKHGAAGSVLLIFLAIFLPELGASLVFLALANLVFRKLHKT
nr:PepSY domain-containing protein [uncultured Acetobacter sp.]